MPTKETTTQPVPYTETGHVGGVYLAAWAWRRVRLIVPVPHE